MEQPASPPSTSMAPARPPVARSYVPVNRLAPRWVPGAGRPAGAAPEPDCLVQPWMVAGRPRRMDVQALPRRRKGSWPLWLMVLALAGLGGYGLSAMDRDQVPESGMPAGSLLAVQDPEEGRASVAVPPTGAVAHEAFIQEDNDRPGEPDAAMPPPEAPAAARPVSVAVPPTGAVAHEAFIQEDNDRPGEPDAAMPPPEASAAARPVSAAPAAVTQNAASRPAPARMECGDALAAMQLCGVASSR